ncbi:MAG: DUF11 domain-containing protein, partial [Acidimicrobiales bacterium]|nr:DUF11 domain-containing protein [Acidimicrobiales bacterium]
VALLAALLALAVATAAPAGSSPHDFDEPIFATDARGDIVTIGNVTTTCDPTYANDRWSAAESAAACTGATGGAAEVRRHDGALMPPINNRLAMVPVDVDGDPSTTSSSQARLDLPADAVVLWAGLHWNAATEVPAADQLYGSSDLTPAPNPADRFRARFATPASGGYVAVDATDADGTTRDRWDDTNPGGTTSYGAYVEVTDLVAQGGSGTYAVADVVSCTGFGGCFGSWSLTVVVAAPQLPPRNLAVWHGWQLTTPSVAGGAQEFRVQGITPPPSGPVAARIGVVAADGDRGLGPDSLDIASPSQPTWTTFATADRPLLAGEGDWFNSTVNAYGRRRPDRDASPNLLANLNQDIALVEDQTVIGNDDTGFAFRIQTASSESLYTQVVHSAVDLYAPEVAVTKAVEPSGPVPAGTEVTWTIEVANVGIDPVRDAVLVDPLPDGLAYVEGSLAIVDGGPPELLGPKTDAPGDDQAEWDPEARTLRVRLGVGADAGGGGTMGIAPAADGSDRVTIAFRAVVEADPEATVVNVAHAEGRGRTLDDPFGPLTTAAEAEASISTTPHADLAIDKTDDGAVVAGVGDRYDYRLTVTNAGPSVAIRARIVDELEPTLRFVSSPDGCTADGALVTCELGDLEPGASVVRAMRVEVLSIPDDAQPIGNVARVTTETPDPDCVAPTPDAGCNED